MGVRKQRQNYEKENKRVRTWRLMEKQIVGNLKKNAEGEVTKGQGSCRRRKMNNIWSKVAAAEQHVGELMAK